MQAFLSKAQEIAKTVVDKALSVSNQFVAIAGAGLISLGVGEIYAPAGLIIGGIFLILAAMDSRS